MRRRADDGDRYIADAERSQSVDDADLHVGTSTTDVRNDSGDLLFGHRPVRVIENRLYAFAVVMVPHDTFEDNAGAVRTSPRLADEGCGVDRLVREIAHPPATGGMNASSSPSRST